MLSRSKNPRLILLRPQVRLVSSPTVTTASIFPGDECRLLFLGGLPKTTNPQERFFVAKMGANALLQGRIQTRVVQAVGRCTRSLQDYSAVVVTGSELTDYLNSPVKLSFLHPELQAELSFGARQSTNVSVTDLVENFDIFLRNDATWEGVNRQILAERDAVVQATPSGVGQLQAVVTAEINYQKNLWQKHYEGAVENAGQVLAVLTDSSLQGYRALWNYLAGAAAAYGEAAGVAGLSARARTYFAAARDTCHRFTIPLNSTVLHCHPVESYSASRCADHRTVGGEGDDRPASSNLISPTTS
jgi:hypothetical protein